MTSPAISRDVLSLRNWLDANGCISGPEIEYLDHERDLISLGRSQDNATRSVETWLEDKLILYFPHFRKVSVDSDIVTV